jgi:hypothetical protein
VTTLEDRFEPCLPHTHNNPISYERALLLDVEIIDCLSGYTVRGILESFVVGEARVRAPELLPEQRSVTVRMSGCVFSGDVVYCRARDAAYEAHITIDDFDNNGLRREVRLPVRIPGHLLSVGPIPLPVVIRDISGQGLRIETPVTVQVGGSVVLTTGRALIFGIARYCHANSETGYRVGIEMQHVLEKSYVDRHSRAFLGSPSVAPHNLRRRLRKGISWCKRRWHEIT